MPGNDKYAERGDMETNFRSYLFNDTTRLRMTSRPNLKEAFQRTPNTASLNKNVSSKLGRRGISQSFKEKLISPTRPKDPPPPPPNVNQLSKSQSAVFIKSNQNVSSSTSNPIQQSQNSRKFIQFSAPEMKRLNRMIMRRSSSTPATNNLQAGGSTKAIYDIAENEDEDLSFSHTSINPTSNKGKYSTGASATNGQENRIINYCTSSLQRNPIKPPRKSDRSHSFSLRQQNPVKSKSNIFNRGLSQIARSISNSSLEEGHQKNMPVRQPDPYAQTNDNSMKGFSSTDLVTLLPHDELEERMGFKDIRKILSSPSISSSASSTASGHYQLKRNLINGRQRKCSEADRSDDNNRSSEHIYEEIPENENNMKSSSAIRPLPPLPIHNQSSQQQQETTSLKEKKLSSSSTTTIKTVTSEINSEAQVKSIFEGATKYDILHYLEDAKERGLTDVELDAPDDSKDVEENEEDTRQPLVRRNHANRVSNISNSSSGSSSASSGSAILMANKDRWSSVDIERNDSGLGSETGKTGKRPRIREKQQSIETIFADHHEHICEDCDQPIEDVSHIEQ